MKKIFLAIILFLTFACSKEVIESNIETINHYVITDDPNDPVQHKRYEIFTQYGVPVYFNDTVSITPNGVDYFGNTIYNVETIDLRWGYESSDNSRYTYEYISADEDKLEMLLLVEDYLKMAKKAIYPFSVLAVKKLTITDEDRNTSGDAKYGRFGIYFRCLLLTNGWGMKDNDKDEVIDKADVPSGIKLQIARQKIKNYSTQLLMFNVVSRLEWYDTFWPLIDKSLPAGYSAWGLLDEPIFYKTYLGWGYTMEQIKEIQDELRKTIAAYGFVTGGTGMNYSSPFNYGDDVDGYLRQMLRMTKKEFVELYKDFPLVMKKANVLYDILENEIGLYL